MATKKFEPAELADLALATLILTIFFSFRFPGKPTLENWLAYFIPVLILVAVSIFVHELAHHFVANKFLVHSRSKVWWFGALFGFFLLLLTNGYIIFAAVWTITLTPIYLFRPGRKTVESHPGPYEYAKIAAAGPIASLALAAIAKLFVGSFDFAQTLMTINLWLAVFNLFPFFTPYLVPYLAPATLGTARKFVAAPYAEGEYVFFGSRPFWAFVFSFVVVAAISLFFLSAFASIIIAFITAFFAWLGWHFYVEAHPKV